MKRTALALLLCMVVGFAASARSDRPNPLSDQFIEQVNRKATTWTAGRNFHPDFPLSSIRRMMGRHLPSSDNPAPIKRYSAAEIGQLPKNFDSRERWSNCPGIGEIRDQGACGSCWAASSASVISDRTCIASNGTSQFRCSTEDINSCNSDGCYGGTEHEAFQAWVEIGFVSGGPYNSSMGCRPYTVPSCDHVGDGSRPKCDHLTKTPPCIQKCRDGYGKTYSDDIHKARTFYSIYSEEETMLDIFKHGPMTSGFEVMEDFIHYKSGIYQMTEWSPLGGHAIKILGWGEEGGVKYWLCANSWNEDWGDKGFFKVIRGRHECGIAHLTYGGLPAN